ncbi:peptidase A5 [Acidianus sulfidivorans JP7]|uniref:Peptidase A5 n=1 Tax=Acidianus sulfidivorans JP7 TaxID=619593 RepID=A0A2U9IKP2_9CREN|nr:thermopsin family protease [Acidianus sulfidivorans]AWR96494.1 peptidase A5 [Acidianus sulfidivorans JP7]
MSAIKAFLILLLLLPLPLISVISTSSPTTPTYPTGITFYPLSSPFYTTYVKGSSYIQNLSIGQSYLPNGEYLTSGNASLQLNVMINGVYWAQDVALFHEINSKKFEITMVVNFWNLTGPFVTLKTNTTTYQGLGVFCYEGPTFNITLPVSISLFMNTSNGLSFGYAINNSYYTYLHLPYFGNFELGGFSVIGIPNDLELVWGGPGGGSVVDIKGVMSQELYYLNGSSLAIPSDALSVGLDTAESAYGIVSYGNITNILHPNDVIGNGINTPSVLWPIQPSISFSVNKNVKEVNISVDGHKLSYQKIEILVPSLNVSSSPIPFTSIVSANYSIDGVAKFYIPNQSLFIVYFPGNFSLAPAYVISSPTLSKIVSSITSFYNNLVNFIKTYNFKKALSSDFNKIKYTSSRVNVNYIFLEYIAAFSIGVIISAVLIKYKT